MQTADTLSTINFYGSTLSHSMCHSLHSAKRGFKRDKYNSQRIIEPFDRFDPSTALHLYNDTVVSLQLHEESHI